MSDKTDIFFLCSPCVLSIKWFSEGRRFRVSLEFTYLDLDVGTGEALRSKAQYWLHACTIWWWCMAGRAPLGGWKSIPNLLKIITKSTKNDIKIDDNASLECFWCQIAHGSALQVPPGNRKSLFRLRMVLQDAILEPSVDSKSVKNHKLGLDWRKPPRKMSSGRGVGKNMKK